VVLQIRDNGQGFNPQEHRSAGHLGLWSMQERVEQLGGRFEIESVPGQGTRVCATVPVTPKEG
jgi:signal transduction histidine kinase